MCVIVEWVHSWGAYRNCLAVIVLGSPWHLEKIWLCVCVPSQSTAMKGLWEILCSDLWITGFVPICKTYMTVWVRSRPWRTYRKCAVIYDNCWVCGYTRDLCKYHCVWVRFLIKRGCERLTGNVGQRFISVIEYVCEGISSSSAAVMRIVWWFITIAEYVALCGT